MARKRPRFDYRPISAVKHAEFVRLFDRDVNMCRSHRERVIVDSVGVWSLPLFVATGCIKCNHPWILSWVLCERDTLAIVDGDVRILVS
ncbi:hypothetical protein AUR64_04125 [Haloprofundus marisrubri]|uniref:Uncharacterized protein n=1 Tax=Haloprofundus marisrubri TaxID=1514971 RepID=A0A0W1RD75_9EURY|nr:hypothetical protein AUR64_04125 [Haloprofundus marisrubri]